MLQSHDPVQKKVLAVGELLWDILPNQRVMGGAPGNFASRLKALDTPVHLVSRVGKDELGDQILAGLTHLGIDNTQIQIDPNLPTGTVRVTLNQNGDPSFFIHNNVAWENIELTPSLIDISKQASLICYGTMAQRGTRSRDTIMRLLDASPNAKKLLDINLREDCYSVDIIMDSLSRADILKVNLSEINKLQPLLKIEGSSIFETGRNLLNRYSLECIVVTLGPSGALAIANDGTEVYVPGYKIKLIDTVGSGDAFTAGFCHAYLSGLSIEECCNLGNIVGAISSSKPGATSPIALDELIPFHNGAIERIVDSEFIDNKASNQ